MTGYLALTAAWGVLLASPLLVRFCLEGRVQARTAVWAWFFAIVAAALATVLVLALGFLHFFAGSLLAAMGERCAGIFASGHSFLAAGRINYLLAALLLTALLFQALFIVGGGLRLLAATSRAAVNWRAGATSCPALAEISDRPWAGRVAMIPDTAAAGALTVGLFRPRILMPAGLVAALGGSDLRAVAAHEEAHRAGRDNLLIACARALTLSFFFLPGQRFAFGRMRSAMEQAADRRAALQAGGPLTVAGALMAVASMALGEGEPRYATGIGGPGITGRIEALLTGDAPRHCWWRLALFATVSVVSLSFFTAGALAVATDGHNDAIICYTRHHLPAGDGTCDVQALH